MGDAPTGRRPCATSASRTALVEVLRRGYRVPAAVIDFAGRLLPHIAPGVAAAESVRENPGTLEVRRAADAGGRDGGRGR